MSDGQTMLCVAGDFNAHIGVVEPEDEESLGRFGWGTRNREGRELVEMLRRNGLAVAGHVLPEEGEPQNHLQERTAQDRARPTGGAATSAQEGEALQSIGGRVCHHTAKPIVFEVRMKNWNEMRTMEPTNSKWWKCKDDMMVEFSESVRR